jgi:hypothetical protein
MQIRFLRSDFIFCELRNSHLECGNSLPPLMTEFIPSHLMRALPATQKKSEYRRQ